mgnify:CR=1 FL=1
MNKKEKALFLGHFILLLLELLVVLHAFSEEGWTTLRFYTTDSNFLCGIASLLYILKKFPKLNQEGKGVVSGYFQKKQQAGISLEEERLYFHGIPDGDLCCGSPCFRTGKWLCT